MRPSMKRYAPYLFSAAGLLALFVLIPHFNAAQPRGVSITRAEASRIADAEAKRLGIPVAKAWSNLTWAGAPLLEKELDKDPDRRRRLATTWSIRLPRPGMATRPGSSWPA